MNWVGVLTYTILGAGATGYVVALFMAVRMRIWLGNRGTGWPRILLRTLIFCLTGLGLLYFMSLGTQIGILPRLARGLLNFAAAIYLAIVPWALAYALYRWQRGATRARDAGGID